MHRGHQKQTGAEMKLSHVSSLGGKSVRDVRRRTEREKDTFQEMSKLLSNRKISL